MEKLTPMQSFFHEQDILVTGGTGFMGKVLLEKMLRDLPTLGNIYILVRTKRGQTPEKRLETMKQLPIFDRLRTVNPSALKKMVIIEGNLSEPDLGLKDADKKTLIENVSTVFHMAASLRLEAGIKDAIVANTLGTKLVMDLCTQMKKIKSVVHLSTAFCHVDIDVLEEKLYVPDHDPYEMIKLVQTESDRVLDAKKKELIYPHPNSYTFSKRLAEWVVRDYEEILPVVVARPSIVIPALKEPTAGWVDSLNGPIGVLVAAGKGVLRSMLGNENFNAEVIPVDVAINGLIFAAYYRGIEPKKGSLVFNVTTPREILDITWGEVIKSGKKCLHEYPFEWMLWYPDGELRSNYFVHWLVVILFQWLPAIFIDFIFLLCGRERFMIRVQKKIMVGVEVLQYFTLREWAFPNHGFLKVVEKHLNDDDRELFFMKNIEFDIDTYIATAIVGARKFCMKESLKTLPYTRMHHTVLEYLHYFCKYYFFYLVTWYVLNMYNATFLLSPSYWIYSSPSVAGVKTD